MLKKTLITTALGFVLVLGACSNDENAADNEGNSAAEQEENNGNSNNTENQKVVDKSDTTKLDDELVKEFDNEDISKPSIIVTEDAGGFVLVDFDVLSDMDEEQAKKVISDMIPIVEEKYPDHNIDIQANKNGETLAQQTVEK